MEDNKKIEYNRAKIWQIGLFAFNNTATNTIMLMMGYVSFYVNGIAGIATVLISTLLTAMRVFDGVTDPIIGYIIDKTDSKFGKFRPSIILGYIIMLFSILLLYNTLHIVDPAFRVIYFVAVYGLYIIGYTFQTACTKAAQACLTNDPEQRPLFALFDAMFNVILFASVPNIVVMLSSKHGGFTLDFFYEFNTIMLIIAGVFTLLAIIGIWTKDRPEFFGLLL